MSRFQLFVQEECEVSCPNRRAGLALIAAVSVAALFTSCSSAPEEDDSALKYQPNWASIQSHEAPEWYHDAKFGIFTHWGLYSVPAYAEPTGKLHQVPWDTWYKHNAYAEWYLNTLRIEEPSGLR